MKKENSYSHILKYTGLLGGVQVLHILISVIRNKVTVRPAWDGATSSPAPSN